MKGTPKISVQNLTVTYAPGTRVLDQVSFDVHDGELVTVVGPSGCGKTTALHCMAGLVDQGQAHVSGRILVNGVDVLENHKAIHEVKVGYVFQKDTLLPWRTVMENVELGLQIEGLPKEERRTRAKTLIEMAGLSGFEQHYPHQLSGGMKQRTQLIRTLAYDPEIILMDEPFGALDAQTRMLLQHELLKIRESTGKTILFVTHDLREAITLGDRVILFSARPGKVKETYTVGIPHPRDLFDFGTADAISLIYTQIWVGLSKEIIGSAGTRQ